LWTSRVGKRPARDLIGNPALAKKITHFLNSDRKEVGENRGVARSGLHMNFDRAVKRFMLSPLRQNRSLELARSIQRLEPRTCSI